MKVAVRYYSRGGNVKALAEAIARGAGVEAVSIDDPQAQLTSPVDILFIGGALYAYQLDPKIKEYIANIPDGMVRDRGVCFGSSWLTHRPIFLLQGELEKRGITVAPQFAYSRGKANKLVLESAQVFAEVESQREPDGKTLRPFTYHKRAEERLEAAKAAEDASADTSDAEPDADGEE